MGVALTHLWIAASSSLQMLLRSLDPLVAGALDGRDHGAIACVELAPEDVGREAGHRGPVAPARGAEQLAARDDLDLRGHVSTSSAASTIGEATRSSALRGRRSALRPRQAA
jgi:hypothetical protein